MVYFKENYKFTRIRGLGSKICQEGPTFPGGGSTFFQVGGGGVAGVKCLFWQTIELVIFQEGVRTLYPIPLDPRM